jgi:chloramphenicol O-acetyltransferase type B
MLNLGKHSYCVNNPSVKWQNGTQCIVGNFTSIANGLTIFIGNGRGHNSDFVSTYPFGYKNQEIFPNVVNRRKNTKEKNVVIGSDVWIGSGVTIMSGVTVSDGAIIAANSHVVKSVEPYSIVGGNPAEHIKYRFNEEQIKSLLQIKWWEWEDSKINQYLHLICSNNIDEFIKACNIL